MRYDAYVLMPTSAYLSPGVAAAATRMMSYGGEAIESGLESYMAWVAMGELRGGRDARLVDGAYELCHDNCMRMAATDSTLTHHYGYALGADMCWYQHSWLVDVDDQIVETTLPRIAYLGMPASRMPGCLLHVLKGATYVSARHANDMIRMLPLQEARLGEVDHDRAALLIASATISRPAMRWDDAEW